LGLTGEGTIHLVCGNHNYTFSALAGAWILGAKVSCGDIALDSKAIARQVCKNTLRGLSNNTRHFFGLLL